MRSRPANVSLIHRRCSGRTAAPAREDNHSTEPHPLTFCSMSEPLRVSHFRHVAAEDTDLAGGAVYRPARELVETACPRVVVQHPEDRLLVSERPELLLA